MARSQVSNRTIKDFVLFDVAEAAAISVVNRRYFSVFDPKPIGLNRRLFRDARNELANSFDNVAIFILRWRSRPFEVVFSVPVALRRSARVESTPILVLHNGTLHVREDIQAVTRRSTDSSSKENDGV
jgi:hypothetical protein